MECAPARDSRGLHRVRSRRVLRAARCERDRRSRRGRRWYGCDPTRHTRWRGRRCKRARCARPHRCGFARFCHAGRAGHRPDRRSDRRSDRRTEHRRSRRRGHSPHGRLRCGWRPVLRRHDVRCGGGVHNGYLPRVRRDRRHAVLHGTVGRLNVRNRPHVRGRDLCGMWRGGAVMLRRSRVRRGCHMRIDRHVCVRAQLRGSHVRKRRMRWLVRNVRAMSHVRRDRWCVSSGRRRHRLYDRWRHDVGSLLRRHVRHPHDRDELRRLRSRVRHGRHLPRTVSVHCLRRLSTHANVHDDSDPDGHNPLLPVRHGRAVRPGSDVHERYVPVRSVAGRTINT